MSHILDHIGINVRDLAKSIAFYRAALEPLGITLVMQFDTAAGFGKNNKPELWMTNSRTSFQSQEQLETITPVHICLAADSRAQVDAFHRAALAAGGKDFGAPGIREIYHPSYYGAFVLDPDGHNLEACIHRPE